LPQQIVAAVQRTGLHAEPWQEGGERGLLGPPRPGALVATTSGLFFFAALAAHMVFEENLAAPFGAEGAITFLLAVALATVGVGGFVTSTRPTLLVLPALYRRYSERPEQATTAAESASCGTALAIAIAQENLPPPEGRWNANEPRGRCALGRETQ
jgi:hypothetical protein